jgi:hypothetical protein
VYYDGLQNRIIRLEMRVRLMDRCLRPALKIGQLKTQLVGLRFASTRNCRARRPRDSEADQDDIKRAIKNWVPDWERT